MHKKLCILLGALAVASPARAQTRSFAGCWLRPAPQAQCGSYLVTEATAEIPLGSQADDEFDSRFTLGVGFMKNVSPDAGVGGVVAWDVGRGWARPARGELRLRKWLPDVAMDFAAGVAQRGVTASDGSGRETRAYGPEAMVGVEWKYIALDLRGEFLRGDGRTFTDTYVGARATSVGAPIAALAGLALIFAVVASGNY
jgi:hypothetical protein